MRPRHHLHAFGALVDRRYPGAIDGVCVGVLSCAPLLTIVSVFLFMWTGVPAFLLYACAGAAGNIALVDGLRSAA